MRTDNPKFKTILWDNTKTTGVFGGLIVGGIAGGIPMGAAGIPLMILTASPAPIAGLFIFGTALVSIGAAPLSAFLFALPFALSAQMTRKFKSNSEIETILNKLSGIADLETKNKIMTAILEEDAKQEFGIRSWESTNLEMKLKEKVENAEKLTEEDLKTEEAKQIEKKWSALNLYLNERTEGTYVHNGKKLFNTILAVIQEKTQEASQNATAIKSSEIEKLKEVLELPNWKEKGTALFGTKTPAGINELRQCLNKYGSGNPESLVRELKVIAFNRLNKSPSLRDSSTEALYKAVINIGKEGNEQTLHAQKEQMAENLGDLRAYFMA